MADYDSTMNDLPNDVSVVENYPFDGRIKGLYCDGCIALSKSLSTKAEKNCILQEELGHYYTSVGNITDQHDPAASRQELRARRWAYDNTIGLRGLVAAYDADCQDLTETADFLEVTEDFLNEALDYYREKYGVYKYYDHHIIYFSPFRIMRLLREVQ